MVMNGTNFSCTTCTEIKESVSFIQFLAALVFVLIIVTTIFGNTMVLLAIIKTPKLRTMSNYLILSLAVTDITVGIIVMPAKAYTEVFHFGEWPFGPNFCDVWYSTFILCTSASILHLLVIAVDRFLAVTRISYNANRKWKRITSMIAIAWIFAFVIAISPVSGWRDYNNFLKRVNQYKICYATTKLSFKIFSQIILFYAPVAIIISLYYIIYKKTRQSRVRTNRRSCSKSVENDSHEITTDNSQRNDSQRKTTGNSSDDCNDGTNVKTSDLLSINNIVNDSTKHELTKSSVNISFKSSSKSAENIINSGKLISRESRVAKTLTIVTIAYVIFLFPFYFTLLITAIFGRTAPPKLIFSITLWLLYCNSLVNPIIYTVFNSNFRKAFQNLLHIQSKNK